MRTTLSVALFTTLIFAGSASAQRVFDWTPGNQEVVRLDPANFHAGQTFHPGPDGGGIQVDIQSNLPVTVALADEAAWNQAVQHPEMLADLKYLCMQEHVVKTRYICHLPSEQMILLVRDERLAPGGAAFAGLGSILNSSEKNGQVNAQAAQVNHAIGAGLSAVLNARDAARASSPRHFVDPNDLHVQYYRWVCVSNCFPPEFQWIRQVKEKYELTPYLKVYGGYEPQVDGEQISVKIKSPVPMIVAILPSSIADHLHGDPRELENALDNNSCQQRGVQSLQFQCKFNAADGPQSLIVVPESSSVPHKKAEIEVLDWKCVEHCVAPEPPVPAAAPAAAATPAASSPAPAAARAPAAASAPARGSSSLAVGVYFDFDVAGVAN